MVPIAGAFDSLRVPWTVLVTISVEQRLCEHSMSLIRLLFRDVPFGLIMNPPRLVQTGHLAFMLRKAVVPQLPVVVFVGPMLILEFVY